MLIKLLARAVKLREWVACAQGPPLLRTGIRGVQVEF